MVATSEIIKIGIADLNIANEHQSLRTSGLGSCVGVVIYDAEAGLAGMVHIMLPSSNLFKGSTINKAKFADTGIRELVERLIGNGAHVSRLKAKISGGAQMFQHTTKSDLMRIGPRNVDAVKEELRLLNIPLLAEDIGGKNGRTVEFTLETCMLRIRTVNHGVKEI
ncbi:chemotaxis protein CheD [Bacillus pakistanensis]|uniref:Probable chemoreceptor glutamine deamidase CheD n=1 Tax=Rossellomorea pakistanensis TaxID=992288 RepID=A0ABS2NH06_9BACI|nr:chemotaxis protein CheD [Bacillus pakistanensis]MBM7586856.1 chemotaxis protein CheD [Bacillus pakistanensis]